MDSAKRACLALIIGRAENQGFHSVYDFGTGKICLFTCSGGVDNINVFDMQRNSVVTGSLASLFDMNTNSFTTINKNGSSFNGYDYGSSSFFSGNVNGNVVMIYDGQDSSYNTYSLM